MVRQRDSGQIFAMKMLHKWEMLKRAEVSVGSGGTWGPCRGSLQASETCRGSGRAWLPNRQRIHPQQHGFLPSLPHKKPFLVKGGLFYFSYDNTEAQANTGDLDPHS